MIIEVTTEAIDEAKLRDALLGERRDIGAIVSFTGLVREVTGQMGETFMLEHYPGMTEKMLERIAARAIQRFELEDIAITHRVGEMQPSDVIVSVTALARHRAAAFNGAAFAMDYLKTRAPFWKKEADGRWVDARESDDDAFARWEEGR